MKKTILTILMMAVTLVGKAQVEDERVVSNLEPDTTVTTEPILETPIRPWRYMMYMPTSPFCYGNFWDMHEGVNAQVGAGVMVGFGKNNPFKGASFFTDVSLVYAKQLDKHWTVALGGTLSRFKMWDKNEWAGDVFGLANYKFDDHWSASIYASYNHTPGGLGLYGIYTPNDIMNFNENFARFGGEVTYKFNNNCSLSLGVNADIPVGEQRPWMPKRPISQGENQNRR